jgi:hypothetical protein
VATFGGNLGGMLNGNIRCGYGRGGVGGGGGSGGNCDNVGGRGGAAANDGGKRGGWLNDEGNTEGHPNGEGGKLDNGAFDGRAKGENGGGNGMDTGAADPLVDGAGLSVVDDSLSVKVARCCRARYAAKCAYLTGAGIDIDFVHLANK